MPQSVRNRTFSRGGGEMTIAQTKAARRKTLLRNRQQNRRKATSRTERKLKQQLAKAKEYQARKSLGKKK